MQMYQGGRCCQVGEACTCCQSVRENTFTIRMGIVTIKSYDIQSKFLSFGQNRGEHNIVKDNFYCKQNIGKGR